MAQLSAVMWKIILWMNISTCKSAGRRLVESDLFKDKLGDHYERSNRIKDNCRI